MQPGNPLARILFRFVVLPLAVCGVALIAAFFWLRSSLPDIDGDVTVAGLAAPVTISRTARGMPTISAENLDDAWFGLGFVHAQDRLWQMASMRRFVQGRLSEIIGEDTIELDMRQRRLGLGRLAKAQFELLSPDAKAALNAYAKGVNAFLEARSGALPPGFIILGFEPEPWQPWHGLLWGRMMGYQLSARWRDDILRGELLSKIGRAMLDELWPGLQGDVSAGLPAGPQPELFAPEPRGASNAWAVAPGRSHSGGALMAGDPHLGLSIPGIWYMARLSTPQHVIEGATAPGVPFVIIGRNKTFAWSFTSNEADLQDVIRVGVADVTSRRIEKIRVKDGETEELTVSLVGDAPVISGALADGAGNDGLALAATALSDDDRTPLALLGLNMARDVGQGTLAAAAFTAPFMNVTMADSGGNIARVHAGALPVRSVGTSGRLPLAPETAWSAPPRRVSGLDVVNPASGYVANANERTPELSDGVTGDWPGTQRGARLTQLLANEKSFGAVDMAGMQGDRVDAAWDAWRPVLAGLQLPTGATPAQAQMAAWNGDMDMHRPEPMIFAAWMAAVKRAMFADELGKAYPRTPLPGPDRLLAMLQAGTAWCDDVGTDTVESCGTLPADAFVLAVEQLAKRHGDDIRDWRWGDTHAVLFRHTLLGRLPFIGHLFEPYIATHGGDRTLNRGGSPRNANGETGFPHVHGAGFRAVHDMSGPPSRYVSVPGQSGNPFSDHYDDLVEDWRDGRYVGFDEDVENTLRLAPGR